VPAAYLAPLDEFLSASIGEITSILATHIHDLGFQQLHTTQLPSWNWQITVLKEQLAIFRELQPKLTIAIALEFSIPRRQKRIDAVLIIHNFIALLEFKSGVASIAGIRQAEDYALDLSDFHRPSREVAIFPLTVTRRSSCKVENLTEGVAGVYRGSEVGSDNLAHSLNLLTEILVDETVPPISAQEWNAGEYRPVPTIVDAACALYAGADVREIANSGASPGHLNTTIDALLDAINSAKSHRKRKICFVTGVPGAGKTLVGLNAIHNASIGNKGVFLSGNGPLVQILREALALDQNNRTAMTLENARRNASVFIQNMHDFVRTHFGPKAIPCTEHVIVFDEAQRAWNAHRNKAKMGHEISEPEVLLKIMDDVPIWAVIIALIGGGQEIHSGEAGLGEWGRALSSSFSHWDVLTSQEAVEGGESLAGHRLWESVPSTALLEYDDRLHLPVSVRSIRSEKLTIWVNRLIAGDAKNATKLASGLSDYPIMVTRSLESAKTWLQQTTLGNRRFGLLASSGAARLRAHGLETSSDFQRGYPYKYWFLKGPEDYRSSYRMEVVATEFKIQGLEIDRACLCWGGDFLWDRASGTWMASRLTGSQWRRVNSQITRQYIGNKYRVLLTRARDGMVLWVPPGESSDVTRQPDRLDSTFDFLLECGARILE